jgi:hypothetical protein
VWLPPRRLALTGTATLTGSGGASPSRRRVAVTNCDTAALLVTERTVELHLTRARSSVVSHGPSSWRHRAARPART